MTESNVIELDDEDNTSDDVWEFELKAELFGHLKRLKSCGDNLFEYYVELLRFLATLELYWRGCAPERQQSTAREVREVLRAAEKLRGKIQEWAQKQVRSRLRKMKRVPLNILDDEIDLEGLVNGNQIP